jgi:hypothetical protein
LIVFIYLFINLFIDLPVRGEHVAAAAELVPVEILQRQHSIVLTLQSHSKRFFGCV